MSLLNDLTRQLAARQDLTPAQVETAAAALAGPETTDDAKGAFLLALAAKGETAAEIAAFAAAFRTRARNPGVEAWAPQAIDIVGTGGDHAGGFNISSLVVLVLASAGVKVMKHGNRGITSKCGSADLLAGLGVNLEATEEQQRRALAELGYVFFFAPAFHPTFKHIGPVRKALAAQGHRTIFNILGPLINPGRPAHVLLGVFARAWVPRLAGAMDVLGIEAGLAAHGVLGPDRGIDEMTTATVNIVQGAGRLRSVNGEWRGTDYGLPESPFAELQGGDLAANLAITEAVLDGQAPAGLINTIVFNAATAMWMVRKVPDIATGVGLAREQLASGAVRRKIAQTREFYRS
ncbi:MAG: anthranilate phosphoribosyltransferase [Verrucomicrobia bacterium]|nr:anthranilate phosphoribosyltransferase [Verrucomicrobiota bacterium]